MKFEEAYIALVENKKIRRKSWMESLYLMMSEDNIVKCYRQECIPYQYDLSIINSAGWMIVGDTENKRYLFSDICKKLNEGYKATLSEWDDECFIEATKDEKEIFARHISEFQFVPTFECFSASDWEILQDQQ